MVKTCAAYGCKNRFERNTGSEDHITFHRFPNALHKAQQWIEATRRKDLTLERVVRGTLYVCSQHFLDEDFIPFGSRRRLEDFAVPSVFSTHVLRRVQGNKPRHCEAFDCAFNTISEELAQDIPLYRIPKDPVRRRQWAIAIRRKGDDGGLWMPGDGSVICSLHFPEKDMDRTGQTIRLREGVTPSLFDFTRIAHKDRGRGSKGAVKRLLSERELNKILDKENDCCAAEKSPPTAPVPLSGSSSRPVTRASLCARRLQRKYSRLPTKADKSLLPKARSTKLNKSKANIPRLFDHSYQRISSDTDDQDEASRGSSSEPQSPLFDHSPERLSSDTNTPEELESSTLSKPEPRPSSPPPPPPTVTEPMRLPVGRFIQYLADIKSKHHRLHHMQKTYLNLLDKLQFESSHPNVGSKETAKPMHDTKDSNTRLTTLRNERLSRDRPVVPVEVLSDDTLLPLTPNDAWKAVSALREQVLDLQLALMDSRIQVLEGELQLQEIKFKHKRYEADVKEERKQIEQDQRAAIRKAEKLSSQPCPTCPELRRKLAVAEKVTNKKVLRAEQLSRRLEKTFTPMQMRIFRTGKRPRWVEEDIRRAINLKKRISHRGYTYIRKSMGIPLPTLFIIRHSIERRYKSLLPLYQEMISENRKKIPKSKADKDSHPPAKKRKTGEFSTDASLVTLATERPPVKQRKRQVPAQPLPPLPAQGCAGSTPLCTPRSQVMFAREDNGEEHVLPVSSYDNSTVDRGREIVVRKPSLAQPTGSLDRRAGASVNDATLKEVTRPRETYGVRGTSSNVYRWQ